MRAPFFLTAGIVLAFILITPAHAGNKPWKYECHKDEMTDVEKCMASTMLTKDNSYDGRVFAILGFDKEEQNLNLVFSNDAYCEGGMLRVDDLPALKLVSLTGTCAYVWPVSASFTAQLISGTILKVRLESPRSSNTFELNLKGVNDAYQKMTATGTEKGTSE